MSSGNGSPPLDNDVAADHRKHDPFGRAGGGRRAVANDISTMSNSSRRDIGVPGPGHPEGQVPDMNIIATYGGDCQARWKREGSSSRTSRTESVRSAGLTDAASFGGC